MGPGQNLKFLFFAILASVAFATSTLAGDAHFTWSEDSSALDRCRRSMQIAQSVYVAPTPPDLKKDFGIEIGPNPLGQGAMGVVWPATGKGKDGKIWHLAVKEAKATPSHVGSGGKSFEDYLKEEFGFVERVDPGRVRWIEANGKKYLVTELFPVHSEAPSVKAQNMNEVLFVPASQMPAFGSGRGRDEKFIYRFERGLIKQVKGIHAKGIVHSDLKPANVLMGLTDGLDPNVKVLDYGLAGDITNHTGMSVAVGTPPFMNREAFANEKRTPRRDIYATQQILRRAWNTQAYLDQDGFIRRGDATSAPPAPPPPPTSSQLAASEAGTVITGPPQPIHISQVSSQAAPFSWMVPPKVFENLPMKGYYSQKVDFVLTSHVPQTGAELEGMLLEARDPAKNFYDGFMIRWKTAFGAGNDALKKELVQEIIHAPTLSKEFFARMNEGERKLFVAIAKNYGIPESRDAQTARISPRHGWMSNSEELIVEFFARDDVKRYVRN